MPFPEPRSRKEEVGGRARVGRWERSLDSASESENQVVPVSEGLEAWFWSSVV